LPHVITRSAAELVEEVLQEYDFVLWRGGFKLTWGLQTNSTSETSEFSPHSG